jgi:catalase
VAIKKPKQTRTASRWNRFISTAKYLMTDQGVRVNDDQSSLEAAERGPSLLEDFLLREKITHFDSEWIAFYTEDGIFDFVGNNIPVFFIQDAGKFPHLIHAVKPEPHREMPQAASAHDTFWDFDVTGTSHRNWASEVRAQSVPA